jgi:hypothetical protein
MARGSGSPASPARGRGVAAETAAGRRRHAPTHSASSFRRAETRTCWEILTTRNCIPCGLRQQTFVSMRRPSRPYRTLQPPFVRTTRRGTCSWCRRRLTLDHHVRDKSVLGPNRHRLCDRARYHVGGHAVGGLEARLTTSAWTSVVPVDIGSSDLSSTTVLLVAVRL